MNPRPRRRACAANQSEEEEENVKKKKITSSMQSVSEATPFLIGGVRAEKAKKSGVADKGRMERLNHLVKFV